MLARQVRRRRNDYERGSALVVLLVVILILGLLSAVVVYAVQGRGHSGKPSSFTAEARHIRDAEESFCAKVGRYGDSEELVQGGFLKAPPVYHSVTLTPSGRCTRAGDAVKSNYMLSCADTQACSSITVAITADRNNKNSLAQWQPPSGVFETLVQLTPDYQIQPLLAESWEVFPPAAVSTGGPKKDPAATGCAPDTDASCSPYPASHTFRFHIRTHNSAGQRITFHDGVPLDAWAVKLGLFDRLGRAGSFAVPLSNPDTANDNAQVVDNMCTSPSNCLIDVTTTTDDMRLLGQLTHPGNQAVESPNQVQFVGDRCFHFDPVMHTQVADTNCESNATAHPIGTGPFRFVSWTESVDLNVERYPGWWQGRSAAKSIRFLFTPDPATRKALLQSGGADMDFWALPTDVSGLRSTGATIVVPPSPADFVGLFLNMHPKAPFDCRTSVQPECHDALADLNVRKAVTLGLDRNAFVKFYNGFATTEQTLDAPALLGSSASSITGYNLDQAMSNRLLDNSGWTMPNGANTSSCDPLTPGTCRKNAGGRELRLTLVNGFPTPEQNAGLPELIQSQLKQVGIAVDIFSVTATDTYSGRLNSGRGDIWLELATSTQGSPTFLSKDVYFWTGPNPAYTDPGSGYKSRFGPDAPFNALLNNAIVVSDAEAREAVAKALHEAIDTQVAVAVLGAVKRIYAVRSNLTGFVPHPDFVALTWDKVAKDSP